jgi:phosphatidylglycerophosphate synthase
MAPVSPASGLERDALTSVLATGVALVAAALAVGEGLGLGSSFLLKVLIPYSVISALVLLHLELHQPCRRFGPANQLTLLRAALVALLVGLLGEAGTSAVACSAVGTGLLASALDGLDGRIARRSGLSSRFGARFDMETDALLIAVLAVLAWQHDKAGSWVLVAGFMRYGFLLAGTFLPWMRRPLPPSRRRQGVCVLQILTLLASLLPVLTAPWSALVAALGVAALCWSFALDGLWLARRAACFNR